MRQVYGTKVTRLTLGGLPTCPSCVSVTDSEVCYRRRKAVGLGGRRQQRP